MSDPVILLPLDGSQPALNALPVAKVFSALEHAQLRILHVAETAPPLVELAGQLGVTPPELKGATIDSRPGDPARVILDVAAESGARLIVLCTHTAASPPTNILGRTALAVLLNAPCPVVLIDPELALSGWTLRRVLLPHEGSPTTSDALRPGAELSRLAGAELIVLQIAAPGAAPPEERGTLAPPLYIDQPQHEWSAWAGEFIQRLACVCPVKGLAVRLLLGRGTPAVEILRVASEEAADLIVLVWKGRWEPKRAETLKAVVRDAPCPIMVVRV